MDFKNLEKCPFCGCMIFYQIDYAKGYVPYRFTHIGKDSDIHNEEMYDGLSFSMRKKHSGFYCDSCQKKLGDRITGMVTQQALNKIKRSRK